MGKETSEAGLAIVPGMAIGIAAHRFSVPFVGRNRGLRGSIPMFARGKHFVEAEESEDQESDEGNPEEDQIPTGLGCMAVHRTSRISESQCATKKDKPAGRR